MKHCEAGSWS